MTTDVIVIGAGAAGLLAAGKAAEAGASCLLIEKNDKPGRKIAITGKGRCNVTNQCEVREFMDSVVTNGRFLFSALRKFSPADTMALLEQEGVSLKTERGQRVFPSSDRSFDIIDGLFRYVKRQKVTLRMGETVTELNVQKYPDTGFRVTTDKGVYLANAVILCTGGLSYPVTGSTGDGHRFAEQLGLDVIPCRPGLIPFTVKESLCKEMMGLSLKNVRVWITDPQQEGGKPYYDDRGEMLFTHFGVSGPLILSAGSRVGAALQKKNRTLEQAGLKLHIDLKPALSPEELDKRLLRDMEQFRSREFRNSLEELLPRKMIPVIVRLSGIDPAKKAGDLSREERKKLGTLLKDLSMTISGTRPLEEAIITAGGVSVKELEPATMMVKTIPGLFMAGELVDVDAETGGFNLQIAFSTGVAAGLGAAAYCKENRAESGL